MKSRVGKITAVTFVLLLTFIAGFVVHMSVEVWAAPQAGNGVYDFIVYGTYTNFNYRLVRVSDGMVWDVENATLSAAPTYANTELAVTINQSVGGYLIDFPTTLPEGDYDFLVYETTSPAYTDVPSLGKRISWNGRRLAADPKSI